MDRATRSTIRAGALGFLILGPVGAAAGALLGSRERKARTVDTSPRLPWWILPALLGAAVAVFLVVAL